MSIPPSPEERLGDQSRLPCHGSTDGNTEEPDRNWEIFAEVTKSWVFVATKCSQASAEWHAS